MREEAFLFECAGEMLVGIVSVPAGQRMKLGVLVVVGGPQYRVGSHRQFLILARDLAGRGIPAMRFDYRGMGDATGAQRTFDRVDGDIRAAIEAFQMRCPGLEGIVLWGLCDGASAAALYCAADDRVVGLVLLNPWVRTEVGEARTYLKHYYLRRLLSREFWKKFLGGGVAIRHALTELFRNVRVAAAGRLAGGGEGASRALQSPQRRIDDSDMPLPARMAGRIAAANIPLLVVLSGKDFVAAEFEACVTAASEWAGLMEQAEIVRIGDANHTFSSSVWRSAVAESSAEWIKRLVRQRMEVL